MRGKIIVAALTLGLFQIPVAGAYQVHAELDRGTGEEFCVLSASDDDRAAYRAYLEEVPRAWAALRDGLRSDFPQLDFAEYDQLSEAEQQTWLAVHRPIIDTAGAEYRYRPYELDLLFVNPGNPPPSESHLNGTHEMLIAELNRERRIDRHAANRVAIYSPVWPSHRYLFIDRIPRGVDLGTSRRFRNHQLAAAERMHPLAIDVETRLSAREYTETLRECANGEVDTFLVGTPNQLTSSLSS